MIKIYTQLIILDVVILSFLVGKPKEVDIIKELKAEGFRFERVDF